MENLGDKIETVAQPIARGIDALFGTKVAGCSGCNKMKNNLNAGMSLGDAIYERWFKAKQEGIKMKYQISLVIEADSGTKAMEKAEAIGEVLALQVKPVTPPRPVPQPGAQVIRQQT